MVMTLSSLTEIANLDSDMPLHDSSLFLLPLQNVLQELYP